MGDKDFLKKEEMMDRSASSSNEVMSWGEGDSKEQTNIECPVCHVVFAFECSMVRHKKSVHEGIKKWKCDMCSKSYSTSQTLKSHNLKHFSPDNRPWKCKETGCTKAYSEPGILRFHIKMEHRKIQDMTKCENCHKEFAFNSQLKLHERQVHSLGEDDSVLLGTKLHCKYCGHELLRNTKRHEAIFHPFSCDQCKMAFIKGPDLRTHILDQHKDTDITRGHVARWDKILGIEHSFSGNEVKETSNSQIDSCETYPEKVNFKISPEENKSNGDGCEKDYSDEDNDMLLGEDCSPPCEPVFVPEDNTHRKFLCDQCKADFSERNDLGEHKLLQHEGLRFVCKKCEKLFTKQMELREHITKCLDSKGEPTTEEETHYQG